MDNRINYNFLKDFKLHGEVNQECIERYEQQLPGELIYIWRNYGFGTFMNGYLRIINPDDYLDLLKNSYFNAEAAIPIMTTAFGDIITWEEQQYVGIVEYRHGISDIIIRGFDVFMILLNDDQAKKMIFTLDMYDNALKERGEIEFNECFGYVPLLALGGKKSVNNLKKVKMREHIALITDLTGGI